MQRKTMEHNYSWLGLGYTLLGYVLTKIFISMPALSDITGVLTILVGSTTLFINWPKIKERAKDIINKLKR